MNSYFSTIAKLSGIQGLDKRAKSQGGSPSKRHEGGVAPLEHETSIMVSSAGFINETSNSISGPQREEINNAAMRQNHQEADEPKDRSIRNFAGHTITAKNPDIETHRATISSENRTAADTNGKTSQEYIAQEQDIDQPALFSSPATYRVKSSQNTNPIGIHTDSGEANAIATETLQIFGNKEYFSRTSEILARGEADTAVVKTRVLQDVQEWVAASPLETAPEESILHEPGFMLDTMQYTTADKMPKSDQGMADRAATQTAAIEQNFELSIGTISIIVDAAEEAQRPVTPVQPQGRGVKRQNEPRFSRLNRSYL